MNRWMNSSPEIVFSFQQPSFYSLFYYICNCRICHGFDSMITDCYPVGIFSKIIDNRLCTIESFFTVSDPVLFITLIKKFF